MSRTRAGLTTDRVVAEAAMLADEVGYGELTLTALADRLGVAVPSLYKHVDGLDGLRHGIALSATTELAAILARATAGRSKGDALRALSRAYHRYATTHPGRYAATVRAPAPHDDEHVDAAGAVLETVEAVLAGYDIRGDDAVDAARTLRSALHGFASLEQAGGFGLPRDVERSFDRMVGVLDGALSGWPTSARGRRSR